MNLEEKVQKEIAAIEKEILSQVSCLAGVAMDFDECEIKGFVFSLTVLHSECELLKELLK